MEINDATIFQQISSEIAETEFGNKIILLHMENGEYYNFNETSSDLWLWLKQALAKKLIKKFSP